MLRHNVRYALRLLRQSPGFAVLAIGTLAAGIGANTAVFSVVDAVLLRPLPYPAPDRLVSLWEARGGMNDFVVPGIGPVRPSVSPANLVDYNRDSTAFEGLAGYNVTGRSLTQSGSPETLTGEAVTWNYFSVLGMQPALGRAFRADDDRRGADRVVIITNELWRTRFAASPAIVGRQITLDGQAHSVVGVMPQSFEAMSAFRFRLPIRFLVPALYPDSLLSNRSNSIANVVGRMRPGVTLDQAQRDLDRLSLRLAEEFPQTNVEVRATIAPLAADLVRHVRTSLLLLLGAASLVLLVACVNVSNLLLVRAVGQRRDVAIRMALGASRRHVLLELLTRGLVLGVLSGAAGLLCGMWTRDALVALAPATIPRLQHVSLSLPVLSATAVASILSGVLAGLIPGVQASNRTASTLSQTALTTSAAPSVVRWRGMLVAAEVAAAVVLATGAGLLVRSLWLLNRVPLGFDTERVLVMGINLPQQRYQDAASQIRFFEDLTARARALPGVQSAAFASQFPMANLNWGSDFSVDTPAGRARGSAGFQVVSPEYFATLGVPLVRGRAIGDDDRPGSPLVAVVSDSLARRLPAGGLGLDLDWNLQNGQPDRVKYPPLKIVGIAGEIRRDGRLADPTPQVFVAARQTELPIPQFARPSSLAIRAVGDAKAVVGPLQRAVWAIDADQAIAGARTLEEILNGRQADRQFNLTLISSFALLTLGLALVGCYGVVAYAAAQRTREIGIRLAFGAPRRDVIGLIVRGEMYWSIAGVAAGVLGALAVSRLMKGLLFGIAPTDPLTFIATPLAVIAVALLASYIPARRAARINPVKALRAE